MCWDTLQAFSQPWSYAGCRDRALCQQTLQPCCLERTVLPGYCCWIYAVRYLGGLNCPLACQECPLSTSQLWMGNLSFLPVLCGWCALLLILPLYPNPLLHFVIQCHKAQSSGFRQSKKEERSVFFFQAVRNRAVALGTPGGLWVGAAMGGQWWEQTDRQTDAGHCKHNCWLAFRWKDCCCHSHWGQFAVAALISDVHQAAATNLLCPGSHLNLSRLPLSSAADRKGDNARLPVRTRRAALLNWKSSLRRRKP